MGWSSANDIFERVAEALETWLPDNQAPYNLIAKTEVLLELVEALTDHDWDTFEEGIGMSQAGDIAIRKYCYKYGID